MGALFFATYKTRRTRSICFAVGAVASLLLAQSCSQTNLLTPLVRMQVINNQTQAVTVNFCTDPAIQQQSVVKMLIILDHSASNQKNYLMNTNGDGTPLIANPIYNQSGLIGGNLTISTSYATDPTGFFRYGSLTAPGTLLNYLSTLPATDPQHYFALIDFNSDTSTIPNAQSPAVPAFTNNITTFSTQVAADLGAVAPTPNPSTSTTPATSDSGSTDYDKALHVAASTIQQDITNAMNCAAEATTAAPTATCPNPGVEVSSSYVIVFASDGSPIGGIFGVATTGEVEPITNQDGSLTSDYSVERETNETIISDVQGIMAKGSNTKYVAGINLFSVYYFNPTNNLDQSAITLLQQMAKAGNGIFYQASATGTGLNYTQFLPLARTIKYTLADVFVTNSSVLWWNDGTLHPDTDMDGLPDDVELAFGTDPTKKDTFNYGISDSVEYQIAQQNSFTCAKNASGICTNAPNYAMNGSPNCPANGLSKTAGAWPASDPDGLNDCEKVLLGDYGGVGLPDSNDDIIPDWLEFINGTPFQLNAPSAATIALSDGVSTYQKIKGSLPANYPLNQLLNAKPSNYNLTQVSTSPTQDCYNLVVTGLPVIGAQNTVRVDVMEKSDLLQQVLLYRVGKKQFPVNGNSVQFADWNDPTEQTLGTWKTWQTQ
jgi:hypothetical protein